MANKLTISKKQLVNGAKFTLLLIIIVLLSLFIVSLINKPTNQKVTDSKTGVSFVFPPCKMDDNYNGSKVSYSYSWVYNCFDRPSNAFYSVIVTQNNQINASDAKSAQDFIENKYLVYSYSSNDYDVKLKNKVTVNGLPAVEYGGSKLNQQNSKKELEQGMIVMSPSKN